MRGPFNIDGTRRRDRDRPCKQCGAMRDCDVCWEHAEDWSPFLILHCVVCHMPTALYGRGNAPCGFCGWSAHDVRKSRKATP